VPDYHVTCCNVCGWESRLAYVVNKTIDLEEKARYNMSKLALLAFSKYAMV